VSKVLVIHGPNLNLLGSRETDHYGVMTLEEIDSGLVGAGREWGMEVHTFQSNHEGEIVDKVQQAPTSGFGAIIMNPAAFTHTSVAIRDAILAAGLPFFEVHISNIHAREEFRSRSLVSDIASGIVMGFGPTGYRLALKGAGELLAAEPAN
jgi:3-dehydroquinate dehydratase-2